MHTTSAVMIIPYYRARYFAPTLGRFISRDPLPYAELSQGLNPYWYVQNNAVNRLDPTGLTCDPVPCDCPNNCLSACQKCSSDEKDRYDTAEALIKLLHSLAIAAIESQKDSCIKGCNNHARGFTAWVCEQGCDALADAAEKAADITEGGSLAGNDLLHAHNLALCDQNYWSCLSSVGCAP